MSPPQSVFAELAMALNWGPEQIVAHIWGYFDESGNPRDQRETVFSIAGGLAPIFPWVHLMSAWQKRLMAEGISVMHMKTLARFRPPYDDKKRWSGERRSQLVRDLSDLIHSHVVQSGGTYVGTVRNLKMPPYPEDVYTHDVKLLARFIFREMGERWPGQGLDIIFAEHPEVDCARFMVDFCDQWRALSRNSGPSLSFTVARPDEQPGLQIADMIAFLFAEKVRVRNGETPFFPDLIKEGVVQIFEELPPDR